MLMGIALRGHVGRGAAQDDDPFADPFATVTAGGDDDPFAAEAAAASSSDPFGLQSDDPFGTEGAVLWPHCSSDCIKFMSTHSLC